MTLNGETPDYDESADYVVISERIVKRDKQVYHHPAPDGSMSPACSGGHVTNAQAWKPLNRDSQRLDNLELCGHCGGREDKRDGSNTGQATRKRLLDADPEDFGLDPIPEAPTVGGAD